MEDLSRKECLEIIHALKSGTPPAPRLARILHVGRKRWLDGMDWYLDAAAEDELSAVRFIVGDYGSGKTHFLRVTAQLAYERSFVVSEVTLDKDVRLDRFEIVWRQLLENLSVAGSEGGRFGIEDILSRWCEGIQTGDRLVEELEALDRLVGLDPDFRQAMRGYLHEWLTYGASTAGLIPYLQWLKGDPVRPPGVRARIDRVSARAMLRSLVLFLRHLKFRGLVLFLDELELLLNQRPSVRDNSYEVLRQFIDDADSIPSMIILCSLTEQMLHDHHRGIPSYPALYQRIGGMLMGFSSRDYRSVTINLNRLPLGRDDLFELAQRIRAVHGIAYRWKPADRITDEILQRLADRASRNTEVAAPRYLVQVVVSLLEAAEQNRDTPAEELIPSDGMVVTMVREAERRRYVRWDAPDGKLEIS